MKAKEIQTVTIDMGRIKVEARTTSNNIPSLVEFVRRFCAAPVEIVDLQKALARYFPKVDVTVEPGSLSRPDNPDYP